MTRRGDWNQREAFEQRYCPEALSGCWLWMAGVNASGYGLLGTGQRGATVRAHRYSYEVHHGPIPEGMDVCHKCDVPGCVNPDHLFLGTRRDNMEDAARKGRTCGGERRSRLAARGEAHGNTRLTERDVRSIRALRSRGVTGAEIAVRFGIRTSTVSAIVNRKVWTHVGDGLLPGEEAA